MTETILASSLLILIIFLLRRALAGRVSARLMYALWLIAAVRLLAFPVSLPVSRTSVVRSATLRQTEAALSSPVILEPSTPVKTQQTLTFDDEPVVSATVPAQTATASEASSAPEKHTRRDLLRLIWCAGMLAAGGAVLLSNWRFARRLRRTRTRLRLPARCPVYAAEGLPSPCLYGLLRPAIYLPPEMLAEETRLRHVLAHEETHFRHRDHIWALLRAACLIVHWFNPLVWLAAAYSRRDCELACDEGTLARLGEGERFAYGRTLVDVAAGKGGPGDLLRTATMMREGESTLAARVSRIAKKPQTKGAAVLALVTAAALACAGTFTSPDRYVSREVKAQIAAGCRSEDIAERAAWENLRDETLPLYQEVVEQFEETPVQIIGAEVWVDRQGAANGSDYYAASWKVELDSVLNEQSQEALLYIVDRDEPNLRKFLCGWVKYPWDGSEPTLSSSEEYGRAFQRDQEESDWRDITVYSESNDFSVVARLYMEALGEHLLSIADHNAAGVTEYEIIGAEVYDTIPDNKDYFAFLGAFRCVPVEGNSTHWMSGGGPDEFVDGQMIYSMEFALWRDENNVWSVSSNGSAVTANTDGTGWYTDYSEMDPDPLYTGSADHETIAWEFMEQHGKKMVALGEKKNLYGFRSCEVKGIDVDSYESVALEELGYDETKYPEGFLAVAAIRAELLTYPTRIGTGSIEWQTLAIEENGVGYFRTAVLLYRAEDGGWEGEFVDAYKVQERWIELSGVTTSPDGRFALKLGEATEQTGIGAPLMLTLVDQKTGRVEWEYADRSYAFGVYWSPDSRYAAITHLERHYTETIIVDTADFSDTLVERPDVDLEAIAEDGYRYSPGMLEDLVPLEWLDEKTLKMELSSWMSDKKHVFTYTVE